MRDSKRKYRLQFEMETILSEDYSLLVHVAAAFRKCGAVDETGDDDGKGSFILAEHGRKVFERSTEIGLQKVGAWFCKS